MLRTEAAKLARKFKSASRKEKAHYFMGQIVALASLENLFKKSTLAIAPRLVDLMELRMRTVRKSLRKI